jgi:hypothetical protein
MGKDARVLLDLVGKRGPNKLGLDSSNRFARLAMASIQIVVYYNVHHVPRKGGKNFGPRVSQEGCRCFLAFPLMQSQ